MAFFPLLPGKLLPQVGDRPILSSRVLPCLSLMGIINSHCITRSPEGAPLLI